MIERCLLHVLCNFRIQKTLLRVVVDFRSYFGESSVFGDYFALLEEEAEHKKKMLTFFFSVEFL